MATQTVFVIVERMLSVRNGSLVHLRNNLNTYQESGVLVLADTVPAFVELRIYRERKRDKLYNLSDGADCNFFLKQGNGFGVCRGKGTYTGS